MLRIIHVAPTIGPRSFGVGRVATDLAKAQIELGCRVEVWCLDDHEGAEWGARAAGLPMDCVRRFSCSGFVPPGFSYELIRAANKGLLEGCQIIHQHGIWTGMSFAIVHWRRVVRFATIVAPHGSLSSWALNRSRWKKRLALWFYENANLQGAAALHATAEQEVKDFRSFSLAQPIALIPNGASREWSASSGDGMRFRAEHQLPSGKRIMLYMGRITPKKGLPLLLEAILRNRECFSDWLLVIIGSDEFGHLAEVMALVRQYALHEQVTILPPCFGQKKRDAFAAAEVMVLPSLSEGFPMVVLDALAVGVPVITTKECAWSELLSHECGWWVDADVEGVASALRSACSLSADRFRLMGARAQALVAAKYDWVALARQSIELYGVFLGDGPQPGCVTAKTCDSAAKPSRGARCVPIG